MSEILRIRLYAGYLTSNRVEPRVDPVPMHMHEAGFSVCLLMPSSWQRAPSAIAAQLEDVA